MMVVMAGLLGVPAPCYHCTQSPYRYTRCFPMGFIIAEVWKEGEGGGKGQGQGWSRK